MSELERCLDFLRAAEDRETREAVAFRFGTARLDRELPHVYDLNLLRVEHGEPSVEQLAADAEEIQGGAGLRTAASSCRRSWTSGWGRASASSAGRPRRSS